MNPVFSEEQPFWKSFELEYQNFKSSQSCQKNLHFNTYLFNNCMPTFIYIHSILQFTHYTSNSMWQIFTTIKGYVLGTWNK